LRALAERNPECNRPRLEAAALACPAKRGVGLPSWRVFSESVSVSESQSGPGSNSLRQTDWNTDADSDPDADRSIRSNGTPERLTLSGSHDQRPWVQLELRRYRRLGLSVQASSRGRYAPQPAEPPSWSCRMLRLWPDRRPGPARQKSSCDPARSR